ncbi:transporter [Sphingomicrobium sediminis]|uniref:Transporter n=1 Tax=Sphingomicrobium sediminis TaxID=2950949 RepID=A0A9X2EKM0_9SPHN|nr:transporter [Sphingomicrobium sediminis]MCM8557359.1 transporter [Sphingomicrobium sediminis]
MKRFIGAALAVAPFTFAAPAFADGTHAIDHAPIGVMADHSHGAGEVMFSYRFMHMNMSGNRIGTDSISPDEIVTTIPNRFAGMPGMPPTLRVVPLDMPMNMHMAGVMYAPSDKVTLLVMGSYITKDMDHVTYQGGMGTTELGNFETEVSGFGDLTVGALFPLIKEKRSTDAGTNRELVVRAAVSIPTGSIGEIDTILTPMNMTPEVNLPYAMQLGSGTWDLKPAITYRQVDGKLGYGAQYAGTIRLGENDRGYTWGDRHELTAYVAYEPIRAVSFSLRAKATTQGGISGQDPAIMGPVQTADPANFGGDTVELLAGVNLAGQGSLAGQRLALEVGLPVYQDLNGPQMETDWTLMLGWQGAF